ncbi:MAG: hypothetical protein ACLS6W_05550 [Ruminococcus sp.]
MSFSQDVRQALKRTILDKDQAFSCLYGILLYSRVFTSEQICLQSESETIVDLLPQLLHTVFSFPKERLQSNGQGRTLQPFPAKYSCGCRNL